MVIELLQKEFKLRYEHYFRWLLLLSTIGMIYMLFSIIMIDGSDLVKIALLWVTITIVSLSVQENYLANEHETGFFSLVALSPRNTASLIFSMILTQWVVIFVPILIISIIYSIVEMPSFILALGLVATIVLASIALNTIGTLATVISINSNSIGKALQLILVLPIFIPVLIFGVGSHLAMYDNASPLGCLALLLAIDILLLLCIPYSIAFLIKEGVLQT